ncbi:MAG: hypothetical protein WCR58_07205 [Bacteroidales bacterium]|jgi:hypothetical protein|nr:hypothetical protein [Bacteroidales bacterium]MDD3702027.1 hypothetical protein [Bacteroidales bacterium]
METSDHFKNGATPKSLTSREIINNLTMTHQNQNPQGQTVIINQNEKKSNGLGSAGFVLALIAVFLGWVPILGWVLWLLGLIFYFVGIFKTPKGIAIAGLLSSLIGLILIIVVFGAILSGAGALFG